MSASHPSVPLKRARQNDSEGSLTALIPSVSSPHNDESSSYRFNSHHSRECTPQVRFDIDFQMSVGCHSLCRHSCRRDLSPT
jgi:hypothetical protein